MPTDVGRRFAFPTYNSNGTNGSTQSYQYPNLGAVAATSVGGGIQQAPFFVAAEVSEVEARGEVTVLLSLATAVDDQLGSCTACICPLKLKVHCPADYIQAHLKPAVKAQLDPRCWMLSELAACPTPNQT